MKIWCTCLCNIEGLLYLLVDTVHSSTTKLLGKLGKSYTSSSSFLYYYHHFLLSFLLHCQAWVTLKGGWGWGWVPSQKNWKGWVREREGGSGVTRRIVKDTHTHTHTHTNVTKLVSICIKLLHQENMLAPKNSFTSSMLGNSWHSITPGHRAPHFLPPSP